MERRYDSHLAAYAYGPLALDTPRGAAALERTAFAACQGFGPIARTSLETPTPCVRYLLSDGRGNIPARRDVTDDNDSTP